MQGESWTILGVLPSFLGNYSIRIRKEHRQLTILINQNSNQYEKNLLFICCNAGGIDSECKSLANYADRVS